MITIEYAEDMKRYIISCPQKDGKKTTTACASWSEVESELAYISSKIRKYDMSKDEALEIGEIQKAFRKAGYQWQEHIFNDGMADDCFVDLTRNANPTFFLYPENDGEVGWGRFPRIVAWRKAYDWLQEHLKN